jgi:hypothetical protein
MNANLYCIRKLAKGRSWLSEELWDWKGKGVHMSTILSLGIREYWNDFHFPRPKLSYAHKHHMDKKKGKCQYLPKNQTSSGESTFKGHLVWSEHVTSTVDASWAVCGCVRISYHFPIHSSPLYQPGMRAQAGQTWDWPLRCSTPTVLP